MCERERREKERDGKREIRQKERKGKGNGGREKEKCFKRKANR